MLLGSLPKRQASLPFLAATSTARIMLTWQPITCDWLSCVLCSHGPSEAHLVSAVQRFAHFKSGGGAIAQAKAFHQIDLERLDYLTRGLTLDDEGEKSLLELFQGGQPPVLEPFPEDQFGF
jgi:hypothetical protein